MELLSTGAARWRIVRTLTDEGVGVGERQIDNYIKHATVRLKEHFTQERDDFVAVELASLRDLADKATQERQYSAAVGARATILRVIGADSPRN